MTVITSGQLATLRSDNQWSRYWLAIYKPNTIYTAQLASVPSSTDRVREIAFSGGAGTLADVKTNMTLWVGSTTGARDLGIARIRKDPIAGTFYIGQTSEIDWQSGCHLTVVDHFPLAAKPAWNDNGTLKLDAEIVYSNQHADFAPVPVLGPHVVLWLTGATVNVGFDAGESWVYGSSISSYAWTAPGASASSGMTTATPTITYNAVGYYRVYCTVTAANGASTVGVRHVMVFNAGNPPHAVEARSVSGDYDRGGWSFRAKFYTDADTDDVIEDALCVLIARDWYGGVEESLGPIAGRENIICIGWIAGETIVWDREASTVEFAVQGAHEGLKQISVNPLKLDIATTVTAAWDKIPSMTPARAIWHLLRWRSNVTELMDVRLTGDTRMTPTEESAEGSLWTQINEIGYRRIFARPGVDRFGRLYVEIEPQCVPEADRTWDTVMTITGQDYIENVEVPRSMRRRLAILSTSAWKTSTSGSVTIFYSLSLGHVHARHGGVESLDQLLASSQAQANAQAGLYCGWRNNPLPDTEFRLAQNNRMIDLFPRQYLAATLAAADSQRGIEIAANWIPRFISFQLDADGMFWTTNVTCEAESFPELAIKGEAPVEPSIPPFPPSPPIPPPTLPPIVILPPSEVNENHPKKVLIGSDDYGIFYSINFDAEPADVEWLAMNDGFVDGEELETGQIVVTPSGTLYAMTDGSGSLGWGKIVRAAGLGGSWVEVWNADEYPIPNARINGLAVNPAASDEIAFHVSNSYVSYGTLNLGKLYIGGGSAFSESGGWTEHKVKSWRTGIAWFSGAWFVAGFRPEGIGGSLAGARMWRFTSGGALDDLDYIPGASGEISHSYLALAGDQLLGWGDSSAGGATGYKLIPYAITGSQHVTSQITIYNGRQAAAVSPTGIKGMAATSGTITPYISTDNLATWQSAGGTIPIGSSVWESCGDDNRWIFGSGIIIRLTLDSATYVEKSGNLGYIAPLININAIRYIA